MTGAAWVSGGRASPPASVVLRRPGEGGAAAAEARRHRPGAAYTIRLPRLGGAGLDGRGAARLAAARRDLTPGLPRRFSHRGGGREAAEMPASKAPGLVPFSGELPEGIDPSAHGVPWDWRRLRLLGDPVAWQAVQVAEREYERGTGERAWCAPKHNPVVGWVHPPEKHNLLWAKLVKKQKEFRNSVYERIRRGHLRLFAYDLAGGCWQWLKPLQAAEFLRLASLQSGDRKKPVMFAGKEWTLPHVHIVDGLPLSLAPLVLSRPGALDRLTKLKTDDNTDGLIRELGTDPPALLIDRLMAELRSALTTRLAAGELDAIGERGAGPEAIPSAAWGGATPDFAASTLEPFSAVLVRQPLPAAVMPAGTSDLCGPVGAGDGPTAAEPNARPVISKNPEIRAKAWMLAELEKGRREPNKEAWLTALRKEFPSLSGEASKRIWAAASERYTNLGKPGRRPGGNQRG